jgi:hypothetical protein
MRRYFVGLACVAMIAGCAPGAQDDGALSRANFGCESLSDVACFFENSPVRLSSAVTELPGRPYPFRETLEPLNFVDSAGASWVAPSTTLTDGASIPPAFIDIVGGPTRGEFVNAAAIHDAYCGIGNEQGAMYQTRPWKAVHRNFYEGLRVSGTPEVIAKVMYAAVLFGGPRWDQLRQPGGSVVAQSAQAGLSETELNFPGRPDLEGIPVEEMQAKFEKMKDYIEWANPSVRFIEAYVQGNEASLKQEFTAPPREEREHESESYYEEYNYETIEDTTTDDAGLTDTTLIDSISTAVQDM